MKIRHLLLGRKTMTNLDSILTSKDITLPTNVHLVKAMVFPIVMCGCENWTIKKAEHQRTDAFKLWCWRRLLRVPWTARRSNQSLLKEISPGCSLEGLMLKLKLQYFGHLMQSWLIWKDPDAGKDWGQEEKGTTEDEMAGWHHRLGGHEFEWTRSWWWTGRPGVLHFMGLQRVGHDWATSLSLSCWVTQSCPTLSDPMNHSTPGLLVHHQLPELAQTHVHRVGDAIQPSRPLPSPSPPAFSLS